MKDTERARMLELLTQLKQEFAIGTTGVSMRGGHERKLRMIKLMDEMESGLTHNIFYPQLGVQDHGHEKD